MSAFSNWNGPGCGGGPTLPQVTTLEQLISRVSAVADQVNQINSDLTSHRSDDTAPNGSKHDTLQTQINTLVTNLSIANQHLTNLVNILGQHSTNNLPPGWNNTIGTLEDKIALLIRQIKGTASGVDPQWSDNILTITNDITALTASTIGFVNNGFIDFRNMTYIRAPNRNLGGTFATGSGSGPRIVAVLGYLSDVWDNTVNSDDNQMRGPGTFNRSKSATAYVKYVNHMPWDAVINMTATFDNVNLAFSGAINSVVSKTADRQNMKFHLIHGTLATSKDNPTSLLRGSSRIFLAVESDDIWANTSFSPANTLEFYISGINFIPINQGTGPNGIVVSIAEAIADNNAFTEVLSDNYLDSERNGVAITDPTKNTLTIGSTARQLGIVSTNRPTIDLADGSQHLMAFISDLSQSIYWQRNVAVVVPEVSTLTGLTQIQLSAESTDTYSFINGDEALVQDSGTTSAVPDGSTTTTLATTVGGSVNVPISTITGTALFVNAVLIDPVGTFGVVTSEPAAGSDGIKVVIVNYVGSPNKFTLPQYYKYNGTSWVADGDPIKIPETWDGHISDITYQWSGNVQVTEQTYYNMADVTWTPHHEASYFAPVTAWQYTFQSFNGYYTRTQIDQQRNNLEAEFTIQPDWAQGDRLSLAYIHNKPWTGFATIEGGSFDANFLDPILFMVDAGDFSTYPDSTRDWNVPTTEQYQNVIIRTMAGPHGTDPELVSSNNYTYFSNVCRIEQLNDTDSATTQAQTLVPSTINTAPSTSTIAVPVPGSQFAWNDRGKTIYRIPAINDDPALPINYQSFITDVSYELYANTFYVKTSRTSSYNKISPTYTVDPFLKITSVISNYFQFTFDTATNTLAVDSSQLSTNTVNITSILQQLGTPVVTPVPAPIYQRIESLEANLTGDFTALGNRITNLETVVGNTTTPVSGLLADNATNKNSIAGNTSAITTINEQIVTINNNISSLETDVNGKVSLNSVNDQFITGGGSLTIVGGSLTASSNETGTTGATLGANGTVTALIVTTNSVQNLNAPVNGGDATNKSYVDTIISGLSSRLTTDETEIKQHDADITSLKTSVQGNITDIATINSDISTINNNISLLQNKVAWATVDVPVPPSDGGPYVLQWDPSTSSFSWRQ